MWNKTNRNIRMTTEMNEEPVPVPVCTNSTQNEGEKNRKWEVFFSEQICLKSNRKKSLAFSLYEKLVIY